MRGSIPFAVKRVALHAPGWRAAARVGYAGVTDFKKTHRIWRQVMADSVYKVVELVGTSSTSWEDAARNAVETAGKSLKNLRIAEISKLDVTVENGKLTSFRARVNLSFKYES